MQQEDYQATLLVMVGLAAASLTGLVRQATLAHQLGAGRAADIYLVAFALPEFAFVALPIVISPVFLPLFAKRRLENGEASAWHLGLRTAALLLLSLLGVSVLAGWSAPLYLSSLAPGFTDVELRHATQITRLMLPAIVLQGGATLAGAALQVYRRFARPALATAVYNITFCGVLLLLPLPWPAGRAAYGVLLGAVAALFLQGSLLWRHRPSSFSVGKRCAQKEILGQDIRHMVRLTVSLTAGYAVHHAILFVDRAMATTLGTGRAASLQYAYHLALVVGQLSGLAVSTAIFPRLAEQAADGDDPGARAGLGDAVRLVLLIGLPATCALVLLRTPVVELLLKRGAFSATAVAAVTQPLSWYAIAVFADALCQPLWRMVYAHHRPWTVLAVNSIQTATRLVCNFALVPAFGYNGLALSAAIGLLLQAGVLAWWAWRQIGPYLTRTWWSDAGRIVLATAVSAGAAEIGIHQLESAPPIVLVSISGLLGGLIYLLVLKLLGLCVLWRTSAMPHPK